MDVVEVETSRPNRKPHEPEAQTIPVVSLLDFAGSPQTRTDFINTAGDALRDVGFFALCDHGISSELISRAYEQAEEFFFLPESHKREFEVSGLAGSRGYTRFGQEHAKGSQAPDLKEFWHVGREGDSPANVWPNTLPEFKKVLTELYGQLDWVAMSLLDACSVYLGEDEGFLRSISTGGDTKLRVIHYPPVDAAQTPGSIRAAAHEDINLITLLCESTASGLELLERDGSWRKIASLKGQIIVDSGDMIQNLTNGLLRSTTHRVVNPDNSRERRFSMPFFVHPRGEASLSPRPRAVAATGGGARYPSITAHEYLETRLREIGLKKV